MQFFRKTLGYVVARGLVLAMTLVYRTWILPLWAKIILVLVFVSALSGWLFMAQVFKTDDRSALVSVLALQTGSAAYLFSVSRREHVERLIPVARKIFYGITDDQKDLRDIVENTSFITFELPQRLAVYVLLSDILMCPCILFKSDYLQVWVITMTFQCMFGLLLSVLLLRVELFDKWLSVQMGKLQKFLKKHGQDVLLLLLFVGLFFVASSWLKKQSESKTEDSTPRQSSGKLRMEMDELKDQLAEMDDATRQVAASMEKPKKPWWKRGR